MIGPGWLILVGTLATGWPGEGPDVSIRWDVDAGGRASSVSVVGLPAEMLASLARPGLLEVTVDGSGDRPSMLGTLRTEAGALRFTPRFPLDRGRTYRATFRASKVLGLPKGQLDLTANHREPKPARAPTVVTRVSPSGDKLPENLLKFYLHFSSPMGRGEVYDRVQLLKDDGQPVDLPFLRLVEELWDPSGTRLTILIDPGRIKRGLKPREEHGPVLEAGRTYTLVIDPAWRDAEGDPLAAGFRKTFRAEPEDTVQPDPKTWTIDRPLARSRDPLTLTFPEALDSALVDSALTLLDARGQAVPGQSEVVKGETRWRFTPDSAWTEGDYQLEVDTDLEDLAGNSIRRPFEVDVQRDTPIRSETQRIRLPIAILPPRP